MTRRVGSIIASSYAVIGAAISDLSIVPSLEGNPFLDRPAPMPMESTDSPGIEHMSPPIFTAKSDLNTLTPH